MTKQFRFVLVFVVAAAIALAGASWLLWPIGQESAEPSTSGVGLAFWILLTLIASGAPVHAPRGAMVSVAAAPIIAASILGGPALGALVALLGTFELRELRGQVPWYGVVFNHAAFVPPAVLAGIMYLIIAGSSSVSSPAGLIASVAAGIIFLAVNVGLAAPAIAFREERRYRAVLRSEIRSYGLTLVGLTPIAWLMAVAYVIVGPLVAFVFAVPLYTTRAAYKSVVDLRHMFTQTVRALASAIDARDPSTRLHSEHVSGIAVEIGEVMLLAETQLEQLEWAGLLHDIGKIGIRDSVLLKPERLTREERILMNEHPIKGEEILRDVDQLSQERPLIRHHHEWYNGSGYPDRLVGEEIPLLARILHVADAFEAMTAPRPYRPTPLATSEALAELRRYEGIQFDPQVVDAFAVTRTARTRGETPSGEAGPTEHPPRTVPMLGKVATERAVTASTSAQIET